MNGNVEFVTKSHEYISHIKKFDTSELINAESKIECGNLIYLLVSYPFEIPSIHPVQFTVDNVTIREFAEKIIDVYREMYREYKQGATIYGDPIHPFSQIGITRVIYNNITNTWTAIIIS